MMTKTMGRLPSIARRAALASGVGTFVEWYDFFIFGTAAALVFPSLFFPQFDPLTGVLLSFATFAGGFAARPLGAIYFGHLGDRIGRRTTLIATLLIMGIATFAMGLLPTYENIGAWAPVLLVAFRLVQGFAVSGEFGGAVLLAIEHAPANKRGLYGSAPQISVPVALFASSSIFVALNASMSDAAFLEWGWRVPFISSIIIVAVGLYIRLQVPETPEFTKVKDDKAVSKLPLLDALKEHGRDFWLVVFSYPATGMVYYVLTTFCVAYGVGAGLSSETMLWITVAAAGLMLIFIPLGASFSDQVGRKPVYVGGLILMGIGVFPLFWLLDTGNPGLAFLGFVVPTIGFSIAWGVLTTFFGDVFSARLRYSALGTAYTLGAILGSSTAPFVATFILAQTDNVLWVATYMCVWIVISVFAALKMRESRVDVREPAMSND